jgi:4-amino-4-deoxy-L-arabinose transferase-like glycosyltransferase
MCSPTITTDGVYYATLGSKLMAEGLKNSFSVYWSPLYPTIIGIFNAFINNLELSARAVSILFGSLLVFPVYLLARNIYSRRIAFISAILIILHPFLIFFSNNVYVESVYTFLFISVILMFWFAIQEDKLRYFIAVGLLCALLYLSRPEALGYMGVFITLLILKSVISRKRIMRTVVQLSVIFLCFVSFTAPYLVFLKDQLGRWNLTGLRGVGNSSNASVNGREQWYGLDPASGDSKAMLLYASGKVKGKEIGQITDVRLSIPGLRG